MGLDISHDAFSGAYSSFNRFRQFVAASIGGSFPPHKDPEHDNAFWYWGEGFSDETHPGLRVLFMHSDCGGVISAVECASLAEELTESVLPKCEESEPRATGHIARDGGNRAVTQRFIDGCREAASRNESLDFH